MDRRFESASNLWAMVTVALATIALAAMIVQLPAAAQTSGTGGPCSTVTLRGEYGLTAVGQRAVPEFLGGGIEKFVGTAMSTFDGNGNFVIQGTGAGLHGEVTGVAPSHDDILGTYEVNANCTGSLQWQPPGPVAPIAQSFVIVDNGRQVKSSVMSPLSNVTSVEFVRK